MYLKELTLRGFKSFASSTTLRFEPGITAVVGPNGSGKSNIVDALTWVMGEQGARNLRGTSMEDVIFAGTATRPALGRAQVTLTIDNSDHALDIPYAEVTISRTVFRNGGSEYAINGSQCRLLDIQELLSDTGLGQQMHVIVGQGRLDAILRADPAGNRAFIEEAAGILKHRKRKERALRKLAASEDNLSRVDDLIAELRRQMGPLGRQARISRRADRITAALRDARCRVAADDALTLTRRLEEITRSSRTARESLSQATQQADELRARIAELEDRGTASNPELSQCERDWHELTQEAQRLRSMAGVAVERAGSLRASMIHESGGDPDVIRHRAEELASQASDMDDAVAQRRLALDEATERRAEDERRLASTRQTMAQLRRTAQEREARLSRIRELIAKEDSAAQLARSRAGDLDARHDEIAREIEDVGQRVSRTDQEDHGDPDAGERSLNQASDELRARRDEVASIERRRREVESQAISLEAKAAALDETLSNRDGDGESRIHGDVTVHGRLWDFLRVESGWEAAVDRVLGPWGTAFVVSGDDDIASIVLSSDSDSDFVTVMRPWSDGDGDGTGDGTGDSDGDGDGGSRVRPVLSGSLADRLSVNPECPDGDFARSVVETVSAMVVDVACADSAREALDLVRDGRWRAAVTSDGVMARQGAAMSGTSDGSSDMLLAAARDQARAQARERRREVADFHDAHEAAVHAVDEASRRVESMRAELAEARLHERESRRAAEESRRRLLELRRQLSQVDDARHECRDQEKAHQERAQDARRALASPEGGAGEGNTDIDSLAEHETRLESALARSRQTEMDATMAWKEASRSCESLRRQSDMLSDEAARLLKKREQARRRNADIQTAIDVVTRAAADARRAAGMADAAIEAVAERRSALMEALASTNDMLRGLRARRDDLEPRLEDLRSEVHHVDLDMQRTRSAYDELSRKSSEELGMDVNELIRDFGPDRPVPLLDDDGRPIPVDGDSDDDAAVDGDSDESGGSADESGGSGESPDSPIRYRTVPYDRAEQEKRRDKAQRDLAALGRVNPLATEEYDALEERHRFLVSQRDDVVAGRKDLMTLVSRIDSTMVEVFRSAFEDTARAFEDVFSTLFPGGRGRLRLEDPDDPLTTGVVVEASPAGKRVRQLSLLSGGERSLTALALLLAIFTARPSPFYVMDEVEAALDDVNLSRLLDALSSLSRHAQLIVITHQQRTMEIADALYGVTMRSDGVTSVISQRLDAFGDEDGSARP